MHVWVILLVMHPCSNNNNNKSTTNLLVYVTWVTPEWCASIHSCACDDIEDTGWHSRFMHDGSHFQAGQAAHF